MKGMQEIIQLYLIFYISNFFYPQDLAFQFMQIISWPERLLRIKPLGGLNENSNDSQLAMLTITIMNSKDILDVYMYVAYS